MTRIVYDCGCSMNITLGTSPDWWLNTSDEKLCKRHTDMIKRDLIQRLEEGHKDILKQCQNWDGTI